MKRLLATVTLGAMLAVTAPALADHASAPQAASPGWIEPWLDLDFKLGPRGFRLGGRLFGPHGYAGGAWLNGETRHDGFSLDGRLERDGRAHNFKLDADLDEWVRRALRGRSISDL